MPVRALSVMPILCALQFGSRPMHVDEGDPACLAIPLVKGAHICVSVQAHNRSIVALHDYEMQPICQLKLCDAILQPPLDALNTCTIKWIQTLGVILFIGQCLQPSVRVGQGDMKGTVELGSPAASKAAAPAG